MTTLQTLSLSLHSSTSQRDVMANIVPGDNLSARVQENRGIPGVTTFAEGSTPGPRDWSKFTANSENKVQLFRFLSKAFLSPSVI